MRKVSDEEDLAHKVLGRKKVSETRILRFQSDGLYLRCKGHVVKARVLQGEMRFGSFSTENIAEAAAVF